MSLAAQLASEKLEDLSRWDAYDPNVCVQPGDVSEGSIATDLAPQTITCPPPPGTIGAVGTSGTVAYYDMVSVSTGTGTVDCPNPTYGCFTEAVYGSDGVNSGFTITSHSPDGTVSFTPPSAPSIPKTIVGTFDRRWVIELDPVVNSVPVTGVRRVTVLVTLLDASVQPPVTFQMSMVRP
jgi:hypothetical protein